MRIKIIFIKILSNLFIELFVFSKFYCDVPVACYDLKSHLECTDYCFRLLNSLNQLNRSNFDLNYFGCYKKISLVDGWKTSYYVSFARI